MSFKFYSIFILTFIFLSQFAFSENKGSEIEIYLKSGEKLKGELIKVDSTHIQIFRKLDKTALQKKPYETINIKVEDAESAVIPGKFTGAAPYLLGGVIGAGTGILIANSGDDPNLLVASSVGLVMGVLSYLFIDKVATVPDIEFTEIDKYPWKLKPYSREFKDK